MKRNLLELTGITYDVLIIGGGIYGASVARDAVLRGLSVALVEKADFASATSANSQKVIHGGLRYLQHADFKRMRQSIHERSALMRIAPHLIHPLPVMIPTWGHWTRGKELLALVLMVNDVVSFDRNRGQNDPQKQIPRGRLISRKEVLQLLPTLHAQGVTGGAIFYDSQVYNSERMVLSVLRSAQKAGATVANYVEVTNFIQSGTRVAGAKATDRLNHEQLDIRARIVVNAAGPWVCHVTGLLNRKFRHSVFLAKAMNIVANRLLIPECAVGLPGSFRFKDDDAVLDRGFRFFFIVPWRRHSLIGTAYARYEGNPSDFRITENDIRDFINEVNKAYPAASLKRKDVSFFYGGLLPMDKSDTNDVRLSKKYQIVDHKLRDGVEGLVSIVGVKYTTARHVAENAVDLVFKKLAKKPPRCLTAETPVHGGQIERFDDYVARELEKRVCGLDDRIIRQLVCNYGSEYPQVLKYLEEDSAWTQRIDSTSQVIKAEVIHAIREEMAQKLADVVFRRTELGSAGNPGEKALKNCADVMAKELNWNEEKTQTELAEVRAAFAPRIS